MLGLFNRHSREAKLSQEYHIADHGSSSRDYLRRPTIFPQMQNCLVECAAIERPWGAASGIRFLWIGQHIQLSPGQMEPWYAYHRCQVTSVQLLLEYTHPSNHSRALLSKAGLCSIRNQVRPDRQMLAKPQDFDGLCRPYGVPSIGRQLAHSSSVPCRFASTSC